MTQPPLSDADGALLSAYLAGDLDEETSASLEARLAQEPALARRLDATAEAVAALRGVDEVVLPPGAGDRLRARVAAERARARGHVTSRENPRRRVSWPALGGVAAGLAAAALLVGGVLQGGGGLQRLQGDDQPAAAPEAASDAQERTEALEEGEEAVPAPRPHQPATSDDSALREEANREVSTPVILDTEARLGGREDARERYAALPEVAALRGEPVPVAAERATAYRAAVVDAPAFRSGTRPGACLDEATPGPGPVVPARVESVVHEGRPALAYVLVTAAEGSPTLDRVQVKVLTPPACVLRLSVDLS